MSQRASEDIKDVQGLLPLDRAANTYNGAVLDTLGFTGVRVKFPIGAIASTATFNGKVQESDAADGSGMTDITGAAIVQLGDTDDNKSPVIDVLLKGPINRKRYVRGVGVGATAAVTFGIEYELYGAERKPTTSSPAVVFA